MRPPGRHRWTAVRGFLTGQRELHERAALLTRPWEEEWLHWSAGRLHGSVLPPPRWRGRSTTTGGWCPGRRADAAEQAARPAARQDRGGQPL